MTTYNHAYTLAFALGGSTDEAGEDFTPEQLRNAILKRVEDLMNNDELLEALGSPFDTYVEA